MKTRSIHPFITAGTENHHIGNWRITASAHSSFSCSAAMSGASRPSAVARPETDVTSSRWAGEWSGKSSASTPAFHFIAYRSDCRTRCPAARSSATANAVSEAFSERGSGCTLTISTFFRSWSLM